VENLHPGQLKIGGERHNRDCGEMIRQDIVYGGFAMIDGISSTGGSALFRCAAS
jgi:hypothetical protein